MSADARRFGLGLAGAVVAAMLVASPAAGALDAVSWTTSGHMAPAWSWLSDPFVHVVTFLARHRFLAMPALIFGSILLASWRNRRRKQQVSKPAVIGYRPDAPARKVHGPILIPACVVLAFANLFFGTWLSGWLIHDLGAEAPATITGVHATGIVYNDHRVMAYDVLIKTPAGVVETSFEEDDFNVYPSHNATRYPGMGDNFNVRYLQHFPGDFVILGEDDSPWARSLRCSRLYGVRAEAEAKLQFAPDTPAYRVAAEAARQAVVEARCD